MKMVDFLGHIVSEKGISCDPSKIASVKDWPVPKTRTEVLAFKGLASYYRRFVKNFSDISGPLCALTSIKVPFVWGEKEQQAFDQLKQALITPVLMALDPRKQYIISTDASAFAIGGVLSQVQIRRSGWSATRLAGLDKRRGTIKPMTRSSLPEWTCFGYGDITFKMGIRR
jgi:hypothetical protein